MIAKIKNTSSSCHYYCYLRCHVERGEPILGLDIDAGAVSHEDLDHLALAGEGGDVQRGVALLGGRVDPGAPGEQVLHYQHVALLAGQVQRVQPVLKFSSVKS